MQLKKGRSYFGSQSKGEFIVAGHGWQQGHEAAGHVAKTVRKQKVENDHALLPFSLACSLGLQPME